MGSTDSLNATYEDAKTSEAMLASRFTCTPAAVPGLYCTNAFSLGGGNVMAWFRDHVDRERADRLAEEGRSYFPVMVAEAMKSRNPVMVLAHFAGSGTPTMDPESRGAMLGLSLATDRRDMALGILEGIALEMALNVEALHQAGIPLKAIHVGSGGARSPELVQMRADVFNRPVIPLGVEEAGCLACGMLAIRALDPSRSIGELAGSWVRLGKPVLPRSERAEHYARKREIYGRLYPALKDLNRMVEAVQQS
jgi:xylulokinase